MKTEREKMIAGEAYNPMDPELVEGRMRARAIAREFNDTPESHFENRKTLIKELFGSTGENVYLESNFRCDYGYNIHVGENFYANFDCTFLDVAEIRIGKNCMLAPNVQIYTAYHPLDVESRYSGYEFGASVIIGDNVWIGGGAIINPGVKIGNNVVIGSGSIVTKDVPENAVIAGNPARIIKMINQA